jgi:hypothetical protein
MAIEAPDYIRIGGSMWLLEFYPQREIPSGGYGECEFTTHTIRIASARGDLEVLDTLCHEIQHAIHDLHLISDEKCQLYPNVTEEMIAVASGHGWASVWVQNPKLTRFMRELAKCRELGQPGDPEQLEVTLDNPPVA